MSFGIGELSSACSSIMSRLDVVTNNLANLGTPGFKVEHWRREERRDNQGAAGEGTSLYVDYSQGTLQPTDNAFDLALQGEGFFVIGTKAGTAYTRKGNFALNKNNQVVTQTGDLVLGEAGPISINGRQVDIDRAGMLQVDGAVAGKLKIVSFNKPQNLSKQGDGLFTDPGTAGPQKADKTDVLARNLESANVNAIKEMVEMIDMQRSFESYQKVILTISDMDKLSASRVGRLA